MQSWTSISVSQRLKMSWWNWSVSAYAMFAIEYCDGTHIQERFTDVPVALKHVSEGCYGRGFILRARETAFKKQFIRSTE